MKIEDGAAKKLKTYITQAFEDLRSGRSTHEAQWREILKWFAPKRSFVLAKEGNQLRQRRIVDTSGIIAGERLSATLHGFMMSPYQPWVAPILMDRDATRDEQEYLEDTQMRMHRFLTGTQSTFRTSSIETVYDAVQFGNGVQWAGQARVGGNPVFRAIPLLQNFWRENDEGVIDVNYRHYPETLYQAARRFPNAAEIQKKRHEQNARLDHKLMFIHAVEPNTDELRNLTGIAKRYVSVIYCEDTREICSVSGYDDFPYQIYRIARQSGETYGTGFAWTALPLVRLLNAMQEEIIRAAELATNPPLLDMSPLQKLDLRAGARNRMNAAENMLLTDGAELIRRLWDGGDVTIGVEMVREVRAQIEQIYFIDWMVPREGPAMTATEVNDRRDSRFRAMTPIVSRGESEFLNGVADRTHSLMQRSNRLEQAPASLNNEELGWSYTSPLAQAQRSSELETTARVFQLLEAAAAYDEDALDVIDIKAMLRDAVAAAGAPVRHTRSEDEVIELAERRAELRRAQAELEQAQAGASAARDGAQAAASLRAAA